MSKTKLCIPSVITPLLVTNIIIVIEQVRTKGCVLLQSTPPLAIHGHGKKFEVQSKLFENSLDDKTTILWSWLGTNKDSMRNKQMTENLVLFMLKLRVP